MDNYKYKTYYNRTTELWEGYIFFENTWKYVGSDCYYDIVLEMIGIEIENLESGKNSLL